MNHQQGTCCEKCIKQREVRTDGTWSVCANVLCPCHQSGEKNSYNAKIELHLAKPSFSPTDTAEKNKPCGNCHKDHEGRTYCDLPITDTAEKQCLYGGKCTHGQCPLASTTDTSDELTEEELNASIELMLKEEGRRTGTAEKGEASTANCDCACHKEFTYKSHGQCCFILKPLSTDTSDNWENDLQDMLREVAEPKEWAHKNRGGVVMEFIRGVVERAREEGRQEALTELPALQSEDGKLFSRVIAKAMEAPFVEVALQHIVMRVAEKYKKDGHAKAIAEVREIATGMKRTGAGQTQHYNQGITDLISKLK